MKPFYYFILFVLVFCTAWLSGCAGECPDPNKNPVAVAVNKDGDIIWKTTIESGLDDYPKDIFLTRDGGYILLAMQGDSYRGIPYRPFIVKLDEKGNVLWNRTYGPAGGDPTEGIEMPDGSLAVFFSSGQFLVLDPEGGITGSGSMEGIVRSIIPREDSGYMVAGTWGSYAWVARLTESLNVTWDTTLTSPESLAQPWRVHYASVIVSLGEGDYCVLGASESVDDKEGHFAIERWVARIGPEGTVKWNTIPRSSPDTYSIRTLQPGRDPGDGPILLAVNRPVGNQSIVFTTYAVQVALDPEGTIETTTPVSIRYPAYPATDGGYFFAAWELNKKCREPDSTKKCEDLRVIRYDANGSIVWDRVIDSEIWQFPITRILSNPDGGCVVLLEGE